MWRCLVGGNADEGLEKKLLDWLWKDDLRSFSNVLKEHYQCEDIDLLEDLHKALQIPSYAFISAHKVPSSEQEIKELFILVDEID